MLLLKTGCIISDHSAIEPGMLHIRAFHMLVADSNIGASRLATG